MAGLCFSGRHRARSSVSHISRNLRYIAGTMSCNFSINGDDFWALCGAWLASEGSVYGRTRNRKQLGQVTDAMVAAVMHPAQLFLLFEGEFGLLPPKFSFRAGNGHSLTGAHADQVGFELGEGGKDVENILPIGSVGSYTLEPRASFTPRAIRESAISRASGTDRASRSSFGTTSISPRRTAARA